VFDLRVHYTGSSTERLDHNVTNSDRINS
jgi:hypothetical protein